MLLIAALVALALFAFEAGRTGLWVNLLLGLLGCAVLLFLIWVRPEDRLALVSSPPVLAPDDPDGLRLLLDQVPIPLVRCAPSQTPQAINRAARGLFQAEDVIASDELIAALTGPVSGARPVVTVLGRRYALSVSEIESGDGPVRLAALTDVQVEMHKAEAAALRDTLHILSHEIMNSLTPVASLADVADSYLDGETSAGAGSAREALEMLSRRARSLTRFIEAYRSVARLPEPVLQPVAPARLIDDILGPFQHSSSAQDVAFQVDIADALPTVDIDEPQISQAIINVITNAIEATEGQADRRVRVSVSQVHQTVAIRVSDNGIGIAGDIRSNLFSAFATTKPKGTGTGLNLARQILLAHGGNLELLDGEAETTFAFTLPVRG
ncbi:histidine kinase-, DNA gyrase B-, and HSP90-like ATPase family protein [Asticcacaulis biprosthecium C19]|uniref:histidine kinase n=2 Tax=Asticcacaulis biprosthecium TaxID=76891 RepID=F4QIJ8_9CAUL|nr:histidine kinase-, DNA gyrase B-, and HSP90-like ATPase family protein [Asticcacaulis biprosthecium C19]